MIECCEVVTSSAIEVMGNVVDDTGKGMALIVTEGSMIPSSVEVIKLFVVIAAVGNSMNVGMLAIEKITVLVGISMLVGFSISIDGDGIIIVGDTVVIVAMVVRASVISTVVVTNSKQC